MTRPLIVILLSFVMGIGAGAGGALIVASLNSSSRGQSAETAKDQQIAALTALLNDVRMKLAADQLVRAEDERRLKAFNTLPTNIAPPQTFEIGK